MPVPKLVRTALKGQSMRRTLSIAALTGAALTLAVAPATAGKPVAEGGTATVTASPNPASSGGAHVGLAGCGYANAAAEVDVVHSAGYTETFWVPMWSTGCIDTSSYFLTREAGTYTISVYQTNSTRKSSVKVLKAATTLTVT